jgi:hypothetical protein
MRKFGTRIAVPSCHPRCAAFLSRAHQGHQSPAAEGPVSKLLGPSLMMSSNLDTCMTRQVRGLGALDHVRCLGRNRALCHSVETTLSVAS